MKKSGIDDQVIESGENMLLTFRNIRNEQGKGNDIFDQATKALLDMNFAMKGAGLEGGNLKTESIRLGKALNDPIRGLTALRRVGVMFTDGQTKLIKHLVQTGHTLAAQKIILHELTLEFGGSAVAAGKTIPGQLRIFQEKLKNTGVWIEGFFLPILLKGVGALEHFGGWLARIAHARNLEVGLKISAKGIKNFGVTIKDALSRALFGWEDQARAGGPVVDKGLGVFAGRFHDGLVQKLMKQDWKTIGGQIATGISASLTFSADSLNSMLDSMLSWVSSHAQQIATIGAEIAVRMVTTLTDPAFWMHHMGLLVGVILLAFGGGLGRAGARFAGVITSRLGPVFSRAFGEIALIGMRGVARLPSFLGDAIALAGTVAFRAARTLWREVAGVTARGVGEVGAEASRLGTFLGRAFRLGVVVTAFRLAFSKMEGAAHAFTGAMTSAMHAVLAPIHAVINAIQTLWSWLQKVKNFTIHIHIPTPGLPHIPHIRPAVGGVVPMIPGAMRGRDSVPAMLTPGEMVLNRKQQDALGGQSRLAGMFGFGRMERFARGGVAGKKHRAPKLPESIRLAEARAAGTPGLGDDITAVGRELTWVNKELAGHDLTPSERASMKVRRVRVQNRLASLRRRQSQQRGRDYSQLPAGLQLAISNARLALAQAVNAQQRNQARAGLRAALWNAKHWLDRQLNKHLSPAQRAAVIDAITSIVEEIKGLTDDEGEGGGAEDTGDLQAQLDQANARAAASAEEARLANAFVATGVFGGGGGGGGGPFGPNSGGQQIIVMPSLLTDLDHIQKAAGLVAQGAGMQPYVGSSVVKTGY